MILVDTAGRAKSLEAVVLVHCQGHDAEEVALHLRTAKGEGSKGPEGSPAAEPLRAS